VSGGTGRWIVGVDIGGTNVVVGAVPEDGDEPIGVRTFATEAGDGPEAVVERVGRAVREVADELGRQGVPEGALLGMGIGSPGPLDRASGVVVDTPNLGWRDFPLRDLLIEATGLPATLDNDANCATYGEYWRGAGRGVRSLVGITLGTGIGGGVVLDGEILHGASDAAAEIGHTTIDFTGRRCACGNYGCLEAYCSGPNIAARAVEGIVDGVETILRELVDGELDRITAETVYEAVVREDRYASEVMTETAKILGVGIANVINILNPDAVVVTGGVTRAGDHLFVPLRSEIRRRAFRSAERVCRVLPAALPGTAGMVGAAGVFLRERT